MNFKWFKGLRGRMVAVMAIAAISIIALNIVSYSGGKNVAEAVLAITAIRLPSIKGLEEMSEGQSDILLGIQHLREKKDKTDHLWDILAKNRALVQEGFKLYEPLPQSTDEEEEYKTHFLPAWKDWQTAFDDIQSKGKSGDILGFDQAYINFQQVTEPFKASLDKIIAINYKNADLDRQRAEEVANKSQAMGLMMGALGIFLVVGISLIITFNTTKLLSRLSLTLGESSTQVASASNQIAGSSQSLSESTTEQAASLAETAASLEEITSMISKASDNSKLTLDKSTLSKDKAENGNQVVNKMLQSMEEISQSNESIMNQINESNKQMTEIVNVIHEIGNKTKVINEIVFQTKLLSFNASVEAARAGEHGKGFAVVAEEVGNLAQMSGNAAKEISDMLNQSIQKVEGVVNNTKSEVESLIVSARDKVESGVSVAKECAEILNEIVQNISDVTTLAQEISVAGQEQSQGVSEISKAMAQLDTATQQNAFTSEQTAAAAKELSSQAGTLKYAVHQLDEAVNGKSATTEVVKIHSSSPKNKNQQREIPSQNDDGFSEDEEEPEAAGPVRMRKVG